MFRKQLFSRRGLSAVAIVLGASTMVAFGSRARASNSHDWRFIKSVQIRKISETQLPNSELSMSYNSNCTASPNGVTPQMPSTQGPNPLNTMDLSQIINLGQRMWSFIENNRPVVETKSMSASALPNGATCWYDLDNWQPPRSETYEIDYRNGFGFRVVHLQFSLMYSYGGQYDGVGHYLENATVQYRNLSVAWGGFHVNADVEIPAVTNIGTKQNPIAGMQMNVHWVVSGLNRIERTASFFISGDGRPTKEL